MSFEDHRAAGWVIGGSVFLAAVCGSKVCSFAKCAALPSANAGQYATHSCKCCCSGFLVSGGI